ncbi:MAG: NADP-dependent phosphogluconate dehydrogenase [Acidobacteriota bacterium]|nr:MAG: NADP-dependent phosphogluconate dehydrogenase [Acidobacteriota bacterium]
MNKQFIGVVGLGVMGRNLALNMESRGFSVAGFDLSEEKRGEAQDLFAGKNMRVAASLSDLVDGLDSPKRIMMMVPAGKPVDEVISSLTGLLKPGDILIDGGNSFFKDTVRRHREMEEKGILYIGTGVSGGEEGALLGPSIMPGGSPKAWEHVKPVLQAIAAKAEDGEPCCQWIGTGGAGHFVKMVHNGIEYGDMQMICEAYLLMERALGLSADEMHGIFKSWNQGELNSYLIEITSHIMANRDPETGKPMIAVILDTAGQKGTGKWTSQIALDVGAPAPTIAEAVFARTVSALKEQRVAASSMLEGPGPIEFTGDKAEMVELIRRALYASKICSYAQGFQLMRFSSDEFGFDLAFGEIASIWREGCIIRAQFLSKIKQAFQRNAALENLLLDEYFSAAIHENQAAWRTVVARAAEWGIPVPAFSSALAYYDSYRTARLPANLLQAQRDFFGAHTYERVDRERGQFFHTHWETVGD